MRRQRTLCGIRIKSDGTLFVSAPLCGDSDLCDPDRNQSAVVGCFVESSWLRSFGLVWFVRGLARVGLTYVGLFGCVGIVFLFR